MPTHQHVKVGSVQSFSNGYGFNITDQHGRPLFSITYRTASEAEVARDGIETALEKAIEVANHG